MDDNLIKIEKFVKEYKDTLVIEHDKLYVLRGNTADDEDYYWLIQDINGKFTQSSCVMEVVPLKGFIKADSYERLKNCFQMNLDRLSKKVK